MESQASIKEWFSGVGGYGKCEVWSKDTNFQSYNELSSGNQIC